MPLQQQLAILPDASFFVWGIRCPIVTDVWFSPFLIVAALHLALPASDLQKHSLSAKWGMHT